MKTIKNNFAFVVIKPFLRFMNDLKNKLEYKKEKTPQG